jgi:hypothetical protein
MPRINVEDRICVLYRNGEPSELHYFSMPPVKSSWAFTIRSISAFNLREKQALGRAQLDGVALKKNAQIFLPTEIDDEPELRNLTAFSHETLLEVFAAIGYNIRLREYI